MFIHMRLLFFNQTFTSRYKSTTHLHFQIVHIVIHNDIITEHGCTFWGGTVKVTTATATTATTTAAITATADTTTII